MKKRTEKSRPKCSIELHSSIINELENRRNFVKMPYYLESIIKTILEQPTELNFVDLKTLSRKDFKEIKIDKDLYVFLRSKIKTNNMTKAINILFYDYLINTDNVFEKQHGKKLTKLFALKKKPEVLA